MHISFVILHYITLDDTIECIQSIKENIDYKDYSIVVVDNGSPNNSGGELIKKYSGDEKVNIVLSKENLGFAKGNNIGFTYAKHEKKADFIVMINNDTIIEQKDFCNFILNEYKKNNFAVAGPDIISLVDNQHQNPIPVLYKSIDDVISKIKKFKTLLFLNYLGLDTLIQKLKEKIKGRDNTNSSVNLKDYKLHGSCMIFSPDYINVYEGLYEKTFMYGEEDILKYISQRDKFKMVYLPSLNILHKEDSSTNAEYKKDILKRRFYYKHSIESCICLLKLMS